MVANMLSKIPISILICLDSLDPITIKLEPIKNKNTNKNIIYFL